MLRLLQERGESPALNVPLAGFDILPFPRRLAGGDHGTADAGLRVDFPLVLEALHRGERARHDAAREEVRATVRQLRGDPIGDDEILNEEHGAIVRAGRQNRLRDDVDLLLRLRRPVVQVVDVVEDDQVRTLIEQLRAARGRVEADRVDDETAARPYAVATPALGRPELADHPHAVLGVVQRDFRGLEPERDVADAVVGLRLRHADVQAVLPLVAASEIGHGHLDGRALRAAAGPHRVERPRRGVELDRVLPLPEVFVAIGERRGRGAREDERDPLVPVVGDRLASRLRRDLLEIALEGSALVRLEVLPEFLDALGDRGGAQIVPRSALDAATISFIRSSVILPVSTPRSRPGSDGNRRHGKRQRQFLK
jgi:hypothetical protein